MLARVILKAGRDKPARGGNPWIFSQAISRTEPPDLAAGEIVEVFDSTNQRVGLGYYHPKTTIAVRLLEWSAENHSAEEVISRRLESALHLRKRIIRSDTDCYRLVNGDGDSLSGLVVDVYAGAAVVQILTTGMDRLRDFLTSELNRLLSPTCIFERSAGAVRREEGLEDRTDLLCGELVTEIEAQENGIRYLIDLTHGQKSGFFLDQRENRLLARNFALNASVLDIYSYTGGFSLNAIAAGAAHVTAVDTSSRALDLLGRNVEANGFDASRTEVVRADASEFLHTSERKFGLIVMDPPPLARSRTDAARAEHLYVEVNALALKALAPGGCILTFSCSTHFRGEEFVRAVRIAQTKGGRQMRMLARLGAAPDHPVLLGHPEGEYLTGILLADL